MSFLVGIWGVLSDRATWEMMEGWFRASFVADYEGLGIRRQKHAMEITYWVIEDLLQALYNFIL